MLRRQEEKEAEAKAAFSAKSMATRHVIAFMIARHHA